MAFHDVYQVVDESVFEGQKCLNVYFFENNDVLEADATAADLSGAFIAQVLPAVAAAQSDRVTHTLIRVQNLFDVSDSHSEAISTPGEVASATDPTFTAYGFRLVQNNGALRNGSKRFAGVDESATVDGVITGPGTLALLSDLSDALVTTLLQDAVGTWMPVVVGRILDGAAYRLPASFGEAVIGAVTEAVLNVLVTSQVSRKVGVGA